MPKFTTLSFLLLLPILAAAQPKIRLQSFATGFDRPVSIEHAGDSRLFIVEQDGLIWIVDSLGQKSAEPFLDINDRVRSTGNEQGLLGLAFHPDYALNGYFYVNYTRETDGDTRISRFQRLPNDPNQADPASELILLEQDQPFSNHNGGCVKFGPDGYLYTGLGDGGSGGDPQNNGQKKNTLLGKMVRIDVDTTTGALLYGIPPDNPFISNPDYRPEIWSLGLRNPWRFSFDRLTGDMWIADVGQGDREEIDFEPAGARGRNYGWRCYEGNEEFNLSSNCNPDSAFTFPVFDYDNASLGCSVTGGFVYRGSEYADLYGWYVYTDYCSGRFWVIRQVDDSTFTTKQIADFANFEYSTFGEDIVGELYVAALSQGTIYRIVELCSSLQVSGTATDASCDGAFDGSIDVTIAGGTGTIDYAWSGTTQPGTPDLTGLDPGQYVLTVEDSLGCTRIDTFLVEADEPVTTPVVTASGEVICPGGSVQLTAAGASPGYNVIWYNSGVQLPDTGTVITVQDGGLYQAQLVGAQCSSPLSETVTLLEEVLPPDFPAPPYVSHDTIYFDASLPGATVTYQWAYEDIILPESTLPYLVFNETSTYTVTANISVGGCSFSVTMSIFAEVSAASWPASVQRFTLTPNPTPGHMLLELELGGVERFSVFLTDTQQRRIFYQTHQANRLRLPIDLHVLPAGTYFLTVQLENGVLTRRIIKN
jgi:glucose/arabinose dehydrogenase